MKSPGVAALSVAAKDVVDAEAGRLPLIDDKSTDLGLDLLLDRVELFSCLVGEELSRFDKLNTPLLGRDLLLALLPSLSWLFGRSSFLTGLLALPRTSFSTIDVVEDSLPLRSPLIRAIFKSGFRLRIVSRMF